MMSLRCNFPASRPQAVTKNAPSKIGLLRLLTICLNGAGGDLTSRASVHTGLSSHRVGEIHHVRNHMSPIEYIRAAYRHRHDLVPQLLTVLAMGVILTYHALTSPMLNWLIY